MATLQSNISQAISEQHDFVGKIISDRRKTKKPLMEKLRRDRINTSLNEMKILVLESLNKDVSRYSKMEKADILEMTVKFLRDMNSQGRVKRAPMTWAEYQAGYNQCSLELMRNMSATTTATPIQPNDLQMHGKIFTHVPIGYHGNTHVSSHPPTFILPNSTAPLSPSPVSLTTGKIPAVVWVPIPSPPPSPSNKTTLGTQPTVFHKTEHKQSLVQESQSIKTKTSSKTPSLSTPTMWRPW
ncbi:transcription factor HES-2 [Exaiptasia diaphana]|uniref:BHLH domain-containing protein n=1 Tax=Exaiptasia diaphana TaxID=2652724 RepID=A0A913XLN8_EXADI|nr:transcription factor HES-2 [Exaiptasia diaphana]KXJ25613.1 Transcription factor HES-4-A [Exaiptasia diaphana]